MALAAVGSVDPRGRLSGTQRRRRRRSLQGSTYNNRIIVPCQRGVLVVFCICVFMYLCISRVAWSS